MAQIFRPSANTIARAALLVLIVGAAGLFFFLEAVGASPWVTRQEMPRDQGVPFSHKHHVGGIGIDCRYCHTGVEASPFAGIPPTRTCMSCHSQMWADSPMLEPVRESFRAGRPLHWVRVHDLPEFVYFDHSIHVAKGVGCETCHGRVDEMPLTWQAQSLQMGWCLECHRAPERFVRPREFVFAMGWQPPADQEALGRELVKTYAVRVEQLTDCSICHR